MNRAVLREAAAVRRRTHAVKIGAFAVHKVVNPHIAREMMTANRTRAAINIKLRSTPSSSK